MTSVLIADEQAILREGVKRILEAQGDMTVVGQAGTGLEAVQLAASLRPDVALLEVHMPEVDGVEICLRIRSVAPTVKVLVLSLEDSYYHLERVLQAGAMGFLLKQGDVGELLLAVRTVMEGQIYLTPQLTTLLVRRHLEQKSERADRSRQLSERELEVLTLIASGLTNVGIAKDLNLSIKTIQSHRSNIMTKLSAHDQIDLLKYALRIGLIDGHEGHAS